MAEFARHSGLSTVIQNNVLHNCQPQPGAAGFTRPRLIDTIETLEQSRQMLGGNTGTEVSNVELQAAVSFGCSDFDFLASGRIFQGVINQICEDLVDCIFVREDLSIRR